MRLINADGAEWNLMDLISRLKINVVQAGLQMDEITHAKIEAYETALKLIKDEATVDALPIGTGCEYRADNFDIVKKRYHAPDGTIAQIDTFTITRRREKKPDPDCPWR